MLGVVSDRKVRPASARTPHPRHATSSSVVSIATVVEALAPNADPSTHPATPAETRTAGLARPAPAPGWTDESSATVGPHRAGACNDRPCPAPRGCLIGVSAGDDRLDLLDRAGHIDRPHDRRQGLAGAAGRCPVQDPRDGGDTWPFGRPAGCAGASLVGVCASTRGRCLILWRAVARIESGAGAVARHRVAAWLARCPCEGWDCGHRHAQEKSAFLVRHVPAPVVDSEEHRVVDNCGT